jgi:hypothetical protein
MNPLPAARRRVRVIHYSPWAERLEEATEYLRRLPQLDIAPRVSDPRDARIMRMARLDCDWYGENLRCFAALTHPHLEFLPTRVVSKPGLIELISAVRPPDEEWWFLTMGQNPQALAGLGGKLLSTLAHRGVRTCFYAFDEASRTMPCFAEIAPHLAVLIHDEFPLGGAGRAALKPSCRTLHRSWVANVLPFAVPFREEPEEKILFLGSELGLTPHRQRQIDFLRTRFKDRFTAIHDHSVPIAERDGLARFKVGLCPEGRKFNTPAMSATHTDRPFWSGCLGLVPVSEDSREGGRLETLHRDGLIVRYAHADLDALAEACERALALPTAARRRIYDHFNRHETVGTVVAEAIGAAGPLAV